MAERIVLMTNGRVGVELARFLCERGDRIERLYLHPLDRRQHGDLIRAYGRPESVYMADAMDDPEHVAEFAVLKPDWLITAYWAYLVPEPVIRSVRCGTVNCHPSPLPVNRGWYPYVHSILDGSDAGVSLHELEPQADTGAIWAQRHVTVRPFDTAFDLYTRLQGEIVALFRDAWPEIVSGHIRPVPQDASDATYHARDEILGDYRLDPDMPVKEAMRILRARSFGDQGFAYYEDSGRKVYVNVRLGPKPQIGGN